MASGYSPSWRRWLFRIAPRLFWVCPGGNHHWRWNNRICYCRVDEYDGTWHGGVWVDGVELHPRRK